MQSVPSFDLKEFPLEKVSDPRNQKITRTQLLSEHATFSFLLTSVYFKEFGSLLRLEHSLGDGLYYIDSNDAIITPEMITKLETRIRALLADDSLSIVIGTMDHSELVKIFSKANLQDKIGVLKAWQDPTIPIIQCGEFIDYVLEPMSTNKKRLEIFEFRPFLNGLIARLPTMLNPTGINEWKDPQVLHKMFSEYSCWAKLLNVESVGKLNQCIANHEINHVKMLAEGLHERKLAKIAQKLAKNYPTKRVITIAGPSSSNKTTFAKRLAIQLKVSGYSAVVIEMDDYFQDSVKIPYGPDGLQDFEHISAMNVELLGERVHALLAGESIPVRKFNFKLGEGVDYPEKQFKLKDNCFLILEGIHGLNPLLLEHIGKDDVTPIYVSALTPLNIDYNHRFPTSDYRLIRRIIRDNQFRGQSPRATIRRWTSVRVGEERNIFPYQQNAQTFFNSSLVYELPVLSIYGRVLLSEATQPAPDEDPDSPEAKDVSDEARRLLGLINNFYPLSPEIVPKISCIREFIGGSDLDY